jgi:diacylglycerol kinase family enzyme
VTGIAVVVNALAGAGEDSAHRRVETFERTLGGRSFVRLTKSAAELDEFATEARRRDASLVAVCGGDGSVQAALSAFVRVYGTAPLPSFLPLRGGSMNTVARSVGWRRGDPAHVLAQVLARRRAHATWPATRRILLQVNEKDYGFMVGAGAVVEFLRLYYAGKGRGAGAVVRCLGRVVSSALAGTALSSNLFNARDGEIVCDGERLPQSRFNLIYASTITEIGLGFKPTYRATEQPGCFQLLAGSPRVRTFARCLPRLRRGLPLALPEWYDGLVRRVVVEFAEPSHYMIDGEVLGPAARLRIGVGPLVSLVPGLPPRPWLHPEEVK